MSAFGIVLLLMALLGVWEIVTGLLMMLMGLLIILSAYWRWTVVIAVALALAVGAAWLVASCDSSAEPHRAMSRASGSTTKPSPRASRCGLPTAERPPRSVPASQWSDRRCRGRGATGEQWRSCLPRAAYTSQVGAGCPGAERCCPR